MGAGAWMGLLGMIVVDCLKLSVLDIILSQIGRLQKNGTTQASWEFQAINSYDGHLFAPDIIPFRSVVPRSIRAS